MVVFQKLEKLGSGSYGSVYKGQDMRTGQLVAMKRINLDLLHGGFPQSYLREVSLLKSLYHENIVQFLDIYWVEDDRIYLIFEYMMQDLNTYMTECEPNGLSLSALQSYFYQIVNGLEFCHSRAILHRDLKPENVLIDHCGVVKLADFGLSRTISVPVRNYTTNVVTLWYRAPELLLGMKGYAFPLDIWALGCVFAEMASGQPLFVGDSEIDQIRRIFSIMGTPKEATWPGVESFRNYNSSIPDYTDMLLPKKVLLRGPGFDLLQKMLTYNPSKRISARKILMHQYFASFDPTKRYPPLIKSLNRSETVLS